MFELADTTISVLTFLCVSIRNLLLVTNRPSTTLLLTCVVLTIRFLCLTGIVRGKLFTCLTPIFLTSTLFRLMLVLSGTTPFGGLSLPIFFVNFILFVDLKCLLGCPLLGIIRSDSQSITIDVVLFSIIATTKFLS